MKKPVRDEKYLNRLARAKRHVLNLYVRDPELKKKIKLIAKSEGRSVSNWFSYHFETHVENFVNQREAVLLSEAARRLGGSDTLRSGALSPIQSSDQGRLVPH